MHDNECLCPACKAATALRLRAVDASLDAANREANRLLKLAGFRGRGREKAAKVVATASRPCLATNGTKVTFNGARNHGPTPVARVTAPGKRASGNGRLSYVARGPVLPPVSERAKPKSHEVMVRYTVDSHGRVVNGFNAKTDATHGDITGKPGFATQE